MLKTSSSRCSYGYRAKFQSLIGMLKTWCCGNAKKILNKVSIPHRYAENRLCQCRTNRARLVSIPHRYAENFSDYVEKVVEVKVSIPHRYAEN